MVEWNFFDLSNGNDDKLKIIHLSDLHIRNIASIHSEITAKINQKSPDLLVITGDSVEKPANLPLLYQFLNMIDKPIQKFAILGNWEHKGNIDFNELKEIYAAHNCKLLINENQNITVNNKTVTVIGIDDFNMGKADFYRATANIKPGETVIALTHCPQHRDIIETEGKDLKIDLVLSGHTHGGQINFFGYAPIRPRGSGKYLKGWYKDAEPIMYVSKGVGTSNIPIRFGPKAEMVEYHI